MELGVTKVAVALYGVSW